MSINRTEPLILAHRGASAVCTENTIAAFVRARELGADGVELDARRSADGQLVVHHDSRLADGRVLVETVRADLPASVPDLVAALDVCAGLLVNVEIKNSPTDPDFDPDDRVAGQVVALLAERAGRDRALVSSFNPATVARVHRLAAAVPTAQLTSLLPDPATAVADAAGAGHHAIHPWDPTVDGALVDAAHAAGLAINVWTVDDPDRMRELAGLGVDGIVTNVPDVAVAALRSLS